MIDETDKRMTNSESGVNTYMSYRDTESQKKTTFIEQLARINLTSGCNKIKIKYLF